MKKSLNYIQDHKDDGFIFMAANKMVEEGFDADLICLHVINYLNEQIKVKDKILSACKVA